MKKIKIKKKVTNLLNKIWIFNKISSLILISKFNKYNSKKIKRVNNNWFKNNRFKNNWFKKSNKFKKI